MVDLAGIDPALRAYKTRFLPLKDRSLLEGFLPTNRNLLDL